MDLSEEVTNGLKILADDKNVNEASFKTLVDISFAILLKQKTETDLLNTLSSVDVIALKQGYSGLVSLILEAAKINADPAILGAILEDIKMSSSKIETLSARYSEQKSSIRQMLSITSFHFPHIVDVSWRLDYLIKSNSVEKINTPLYRIALKTEEPEGKTKTVEFSCTMDQLQDLVSKLKDATKQIERSAGKT